MHKPHKLQRLGPALSLIDTLTAPAPDRVSLAVLPNEKRPFIGLFERLRAIATNPIGLFDGGRIASGGKPFALRIPFNFDLTFLPGRAGYRFVLGLPAETGQMGPVMKRVPTVGSWYPRTDQSPEHLQALLLAGRSFMASDIFTRERLSQADTTTRTTLERHAQRWTTTPSDLGEILMDVIYDTSAEFMVGPALWGRIAHQVSPLLREIAEGVDVSRTAICHTPLVFFTKEYRATRKLRAILDEVIAEHDASGRFALLDALEGIELGDSTLHRDDRSWMLMYLLWNAVTYLGPYALWSVLDVVSRPDVLEAVRARTSNQFVEHCMLETLRVNPVGSLVRHTEEELTFEHEGQSYRIPAGGYVGTLVWALHRDEQTYQNPERYDPWRYTRGEPVPSAFGRGAFGCIATRFIRTVITGLITEVTDRFDIELNAPLPEKVVRIHLLAPHTPIPASLHPRASATSASYDTPPPKASERTTRKCPFH